MKKVDRELTRYIWRHDIDNELFTLIDKETGKTFTIDRIRRFSLQRAIVSANQRERFKRPRQKKK